MRGRRRGFTLLEVLLAAGLMLIVLLAVHELTMQARRVARATARGFEHERRSIQVLRRLRFALGTASPLLQGHEDNDFRGAGEELRFTSLDYRPDPRALAAAQQVGFLDPGGAGGTEGRPATLILGTDESGAFLEVLPHGFLSRDPEAEELRFRESFPGIRRLEIDYFDGEEWKVDWSLRATLKLPRLVRLRFELLRDTPAGPLAEPAELVVPLRAQRDVSIK